MQELITKIGNGKPIHKEPEMYKLYEEKASINVYKTSNKPI